MSLRLRLLLSLLALAAVGLLIVDAVSYSSLRSHLSQRVDQQVEAARIPASTELLRQRFGAGSTSGCRRRSREGPPSRCAAAGCSRRVDAGRPGGGLPPRGEGGPPPGAPPEGRRCCSCPPGPTRCFATPRAARWPGPCSATARAGSAPRSFPSRSPSPGRGAPPRPSPCTGAETGRPSSAPSPFSPGAGFTAVVAVPLSDYKDTLHHVALIGAHRHRRGSDRPRAAGLVADPPRAAPPGGDRRDRGPDRRRRSLAAGPGRPTRAPRSAGSGWR